MGVSLSPIMPTSVSMCCVLQCMFSKHSIIVKTVEPMIRVSRYLLQILTMAIIPISNLSSPEQTNRLQNDTRPAQFVCGVHVYMPIYTVYIYIYI